MSKPPDGVNVTRSFLSNWPYSVRCGPSKRSAPTDRVTDRQQIVDARLSGVAALTPVTTARRVERVVEEAGRQPEASECHPRRDAGRVRFVAEPISTLAELERVSSLSKNV